MTVQFTRRFRVRHYELDAFGHVNNVVFVQYMQEAAIEASTALGFSPAWYLERGTLWVVRRLSVRYLAELAYGDEVDIDTWVSRMRGVRSFREYDLKRVRDGVRVARGRAEWVYVDGRTGQPTRLAEEFAGFEPSDELEELGIRPAKMRPTEGAHRYVSRRRVQFHEQDLAQHVNHAVFLQWIGQAYFEAIREARCPLERMRSDGWFVLQGGHEMEYFAPARANDNIEIVSWVCELGKVRGAWTHEVYNADTRQLLARDYSLGVFLNLEGRPIAPPAEALEAVVRGPVV